MKLCLFILALSLGIEASPLLIGGQVAKDHEYRSSVMISMPNHCSATKIGPRLYLTAAHCILTRDLKKLRNSIGSKIKIKTHFKDRESIYKVESIVEDVKVHPSVQAKVRDFEKDRRSYTTTEVVAQTRDIALIRIRDHFPLIPDSKLDFEPVLHSEKLIIGGFGCRWPATFMSEIYIYAKVKNISEAKALKLAAKNATDLPIFPQNITTSWLQDKVSACDGDSGGAIFRASNGKIVGVNSWVSTYIQKNKIVSPELSVGSPLEGLAEWYVKITR